MDIAHIFKDLVMLGLEKFGLFYSKYRGFVYDNNDPKGFGRIKLSVPEIFGDAVLDYWAWPANNFAGNGYGSQCLPQTNDIIWVEFEKGNPRKPIWSHGYFGTDEKPEELKNVKNYWFKTPGGNLIELDDDTEVIRITHKSGRVIEMNGDNISLGSKDHSAEPAALADTLKGKLETLIDILKSAKVNTAIGPQGFLPIFIEQLDSLKDSLDEFISQNTTLD